MAEPLPAHRAREYETIFIVHPETPAETMDQIAERVTDVISRLEGKLLKAENWGKRRLAYPVKKQQAGYYIYVRYLGYADMVHEIERNLRMLEPVIKYITVKIEEDVNPDARPVIESDISFVPQVEEEPEPETDDDASDEDDEDTDEDADEDDSDDSDDSAGSDDSAEPDSSVESDNSNNDAAGNDDGDDDKNADE